MSSKFELNLITEFVRKNKNNSNIQDLIEDKSDFIGFNGRFSDKRYNLYLALKLSFYSKNVWLAFGSGWKVESIYFYMYDEDKNLIIEKAIAKDEFKYKQKPTKRDSKNTLRKERFSEMNGALSFELSYPETIEEVPFFLKELQGLTLMKIAADDITKPLIENTLFNDVEVDVSKFKQEYEEGGVKKRLVNYYERNPKLRMQAIRLHGLDCMVCGFNFKQKYGDLGENFVEVHHLVPISTISSKQNVDPKHDLVCVCANCHRMLHRSANLKSIEDLQSIINQSK